MKRQIKHLTNNITRQPAFLCITLPLWIITCLFLQAGMVNAQQHNLFSPDLQILIESVEDKVIEWRRDIHQHPELGNREFRTAALVADHLRSIGLDEVHTEVAHTGVVGVLHGAHPGPVVALRADMDALPVTERVDIPFASTVRTVFNGQEVGVMHACGHDTHVAMLMGTAEVLANYRENLHGSVKFIFQPAEEGPPEGEEGGAELMVKEGVLHNPDVDVIFAIHINSILEIGHIGYTPGGTMASADDFRIVVHGEQTHGAYPWGGADPIVASAQIITALQTIVSRRMVLTENPAVVTIGAIRGGVRSNIIPEEVEMLGTMRALHPDDRIAMIAHMHEIIENTARAMGVSATLTLPVTTSYPVTYNDVDLTNRMVPVLQTVAGSDNVILEKPVMGAEDFSFFAEQVPGFFIGLGGRPSDVPASEAAPHHTPDFYIDDSRLNLGVKAFVAMTLEYLNNR
ncbi:MAG: amidohydrolase [Balneolaceae bacterium]|nr:MAG: amidohydrolase [Balneolaceae bacterium]